MPDSRIWNEHVRNGEAFSAENFLTAGGGLSPHVQLLNPVGSGIRVRLRSLNSILNAAIGHTIRLHNTPLTTIGVPATFIVENLLAGGPAAVAEMRSQSSAAVLGTIFWSLSASANIPAIYPPGGREWGFDLLQGEGLLVHSTGGSTIVVNWQWVEVPL